MMFRFKVNDSGAADILDRNGIPYDYDSYDRFLIDDLYAKEATEAWDEAGIEYSEI